MFTFPIRPSALTDAGDGVEVFTDQDWDREVLASPLPVAVTFWADWCVPCGTALAVLSEAAAEYRGQLRLGRVDVDGNPDLSRRYKIQGLPTVLLIEAGRVIERKVGLMAKDDYLRMLDTRVPE